MRSLLFPILVVLFLAPAIDIDAQVTPSADAALPLDSRIVTGKLKNGVTYYLRRNARPKGRVELRLAVNAGSVLEDDDQQGLAHFTEHMCFNGTKNFRKQELVSFMESIGMRFGGDVNASTSFDETIYMLQAPTDKPEVLDRAFQIMEDWAHLVSFDDDEIDKERGVIIEEWRQGRGAEARIRDRQFPVLYKDSKYAVRMPIGRKEILESFTHEALRRFYTTWYRPDLMAIAVVGDLPVKDMEDFVRRHFENIPATAAPRERTLFTVPMHKETRFVTTVDPEATRSSVSVNFKRPVPEERTVGDFRRNVVEDLYNGMFNARLRELAQLADPPFVNGMSMSGRSIRTLGSYVLNAMVQEGGVEKGLNALIVEAERVRRFGFTATELDRQKIELLRSMEKAVKEKDKTESRVYVNQCVRHFLRGDAMPGEESEFALAKSLLPGISIQEINMLAKDLMPDENLVVTASGPKKANVEFPDEAALAKVISTAKSGSIDAYVDRVITTPLVAAPPAAGKITGEKSIAELGVTEWTLSNGVRVIVKPTDFKNDEVLFSAYSPGGSSLFPASRLMSVMLAPGIVQEGGLGDFPQTELRKYLTGKIVRVNPSIRELWEGISGSASPQDLATMFQLIHLNFTAPRKDAGAFQSYTKRLAAMLHNRSAQPESALEDTLLVTTAGYHERRVPMTEERLRAATLDDAFEAYRDRFADAGDFVFTIVGSVNLETLKPLVETWLGGLPATHRKETWKDPDVRFPETAVNKDIRKGLEPKGAVRLVMSGAMDWTPRERFALNAAVSILRIKLRESVREDKGGTYGVAVNVSMDKLPKPRYTLTIGFGCNPERVTELLATVRQEVEKMRGAMVDAKYLDKVREQLLRQREVNLKENMFWLATLENFSQNAEDPLEIQRYGANVENVTLQQVQDAATRYFTIDSGVRVVLLPELR